MVRPEPDLANQVEHKGCDANTKLWKTGDKASKDLASLRKRKVKFISNVLVINDPANPENNGKVFLYKYGKKVYEKILSALSPKFADTQAFDPFHFWEGANFRLRMFTNDDKQVTYENSAFDAPTPIWTVFRDGKEDESVIEQIWKSEYGLDEFISATTHKSYEEIEKRFMDVESITSGSPMPTRGVSGGYEFDNTPKSEEDVPEATGKFKNFMEKMKKEEVNTSDSSFDIDDDIPF